MTPTVRPRPITPTVLAIGSMKGGVAKTTTALYLAAYMARRLGGTAACPVVGLIDRDESRNLTTLLDMRPDLRVPGLVLLPGEDVPAASAASDAASDLRLVIIDTPPGFKAIRSLRAAHLVIVPTVPEDQGVANLVKYLQRLDDERLMVNPHMQLVAVLPTKTLPRTQLHTQRLADIMAIAARRTPPLLVLPPVPHRMSIANYDLRAAEYAIVGEEVARHAAF